jgi:hypothetical protein
MWPPIRGQADGGRIHVAQEIQCFRALRALPLEIADLDEVT